MAKLGSVALVVGVVIALNAPAFGQEATGAKQPAPDNCFFVNQFQTWRAPDSKTIYIRVLGQRYYRLDLSASCPALKWPNAHLVTKTRGPETLCSALDWDLRVATGGSGFAQPCIVRTMTALSSKDAASLPRSDRP